VLARIKYSDDPREAFDTIEVCKKLRVTNDDNSTKGVEGKNYHHLDTSWCCCTILVQGMEV